jgi:hypothetical protein
MGCSGAKDGSMSRILIIEDDPAIRYGLKDNLMWRFHKVVENGNGTTG